MSCSPPVGSREQTGLRIQMRQGSTGATEKFICHFPLRIGRDNADGLSLSGLWVGKFHCEIRSSAAGYMVVDQGTLAGTLVNGQRISEYGPLEVGDEIQIGSWILKIQPSEAHSEKNFSDPQGKVDRAVAALRNLMDLRRKDWREASDQVVRSECRELLLPIVDEFISADDEIDADDFIERVIAESVGLGPLERLFDDPDISEIMVNRYDQIFIEKNGMCQRIDLRFSSEDSVRAVIDRIVSPLGRRIDDASPMVDARLADGSRVNAVIRPLAVKGSSLTIRRFSRKRMGPEDLLALGSVNEQMLMLLRMAVEHRFNIVISGGTGSGKTTLLNLLSQWVPSHERLVTIEDAAELQLEHDNLVSLEVRQSNAEGQGRVTVRELLRNSLRMRPDRIVVGECRGGEALDMLQAMNTGHEGSLTTVHANTPRDALSRLEVMVLMAGFDLPLIAIREQVASAVDVVVQQQRCSDGKRRVVSISEVTGVESGVVQTQEIFSWRPDLKSFIASGMVPNIVERLSHRGISVDMDAMLGFSGAL